MQQIMIQTRGPQILHQWLLQSSTQMIISLHVEFNEMKTEIDRI